MSTLLYEGNCFNCMFETATLSYREEGQFAGKPSRNQFIELFCYDIDLFMFNPMPELRTFVQVRSLIKTARWLGYDKYKTLELIRANFIDYKELNPIYFDYETNIPLIDTIIQFISDVFKK